MEKKIKCINFTSLFFIIIFTVAGCLTTASIPMNAGEFRDVFKQESEYAKKESYEVPVSIEKITSNFSKLAPKCFNVTINSTASNAFGQISKSSFHYKSTVIPGKTKAELHVQRYNEGDQVYLEIPEDGLYSVVADATKLSRNKTRIDIYYEKIFGTPVAEAIKGWTRNKNLNCPNLEM